MHELTPEDSVEIRILHQAGLAGVLLGSWKGHFTCDSVKIKEEALDDVLSALAQSQETLYEHVNDSVIFGESNGVQEGEQHYDLYSEKLQRSFTVKVDMEVPEAIKNFWASRPAFQRPQPWWKRVLGTFGKKNG